MDSSEDGTYCFRTKVPDRNKRWICHKSNFDDTKWLKNQKEFQKLVLGCDGAINGEVGDFSTETFVLQNENCFEYGDNGDYAKVIK